MTTSAAKTNDSLWAERVRLARERRADREIRTRPGRYSASAPRSWAQRLESAEPPRFLRVVPTKSPAAGGPELVLEVGAVRVAPRFDPALLADVVRAFGAAR